MVVSFGLNQAFRARFHDLMMAKKTRSVRAGVRDAGFTFPSLPGYTRSWRIDYCHSRARSPNRCDCTLTTQKRWPVGAAMTHQVLT